MEKILNNLKAAIEQAETDMRMIASNNIISKQENSEYHNQTMQNIQIIEKMKGMISTYRQTGFPLHTHIRGRRLKAVYVDGIKYQAKYMKDVARVICQMLLLKHPSELELCCDNIVTTEKGEKVITFNKNKINWDHCDKVSYNDKTLYFDANKLAINNMALLRKLLNQISFDESRIILDIDDEYIRKTRTNKKSS